MLCGKDSPARKPRAGDFLPHSPGLQWQSPSGRCHHFRPPSKKYTAVWPRLLAGPELLDLQLPKMRAGRKMSFTEHLYRCRLAESKEHKQTAMQIVHKSPTSCGVQPKACTRCNFAVTIATISAQVLLATSHFGSFCILFADCDSGTGLSSLNIPIIAETPVKRSSAGLRHAVSDLVGHPRGGLQ